MERALPSPSKGRGLLVADAPHRPHPKFSAPSERGGAGSPGNPELHPLYSIRRGDPAMIVEAEWNKRSGRGFNSRRLHHEPKTASALVS